ncbi:hypothetical protein GCK72_020490 [Caenorhabditis remanei]|uniref:Uncharacterized protein n=1 Tax=Caenorhabditis remanei TaxID=31234 RepID=A0A6A5GGX2_CAERE|nr:hypothetical protein GCK72_020490 [Caenorhabditis remanei]KAF1753933.1 hypothetical protein GCK72_020490 [Caenorhabditis remanei]
MSSSFPTAVWSRFLPIIILIGLLTLLIFLTKRSQDSNSNPNPNRDISVTDSKNLRSAAAEPSSVYDLNEYSVKTLRGYVSLHELNEKVFKPFGYEISKPTLPVPTVRMMNEPTCETVFTEWHSISQKQQPDVPPKQLPVDDTNAFLLNGYTALSEWYFNDHSTTGDKPRNWNRIGEFMKFTKTELSALAYSYNKESESMYHAMSGYPLDGQNGFVVGSMQPWVEVMALQHGAKKILTVEYNPLEIQEEYAGTFDFAASFSSIEHSGLGRYGDPIDPIGDLREMLKIKCMLKKGGLLFLGIPYGTDAMQFNAHRIYGSIRLAMMFFGFDWLASYSGEQEQPIDLDSIRLHSKGLSQLTQYTLVLRKL